MMCITYKTMTKVSFEDSRYDKERQREVCIDLDFSRKLYMIRSFRSCFRHAPDVVHGTGGKDVHPTHLLQKIGVMT